MQFAQYFDWSRSDAAACVSDTPDESCTRNTSSLGEAPRGAPSPIYPHVRAAIAAEFPSSPCLTTSASEQRRSASHTPAEGPAYPRQHPARKGSAGNKRRIRRRYWRGPRGPAPPEWYVHSTCSRMITRPRQREAPGHQAYPLTHQPTPPPPNNNAQGPPPAHQQSCQRKDNRPKWADMSADSDEEGEKDGAAPGGNTPNIALVAGPTPSPGGDTEFPAPVGKPVHDELPPHSRRCQPASAGQPPPPAGSGHTLLGVPTFHPSAHWRPSLRPLPVGALREPSLAPILRPPTPGTPPSGRKPVQGWTPRLQPHPLWDSICGSHQPWVTIARRPKGPSTAQLCHAPNHPRGFAAPTYWACLQDEA